MQDGAAFCRRVYRLLEGFGLVALPIGPHAKIGNRECARVGEYRTGKLTLKSNTNLSGVPGRSVLKHLGDGAFLVAKSAKNIRLSGLELNGKSNALLSANEVEGLSVTGCKITGSSGNCISLNKCSGQIADNEISISQIFQHASSRNAREVCV